MMGGRASKAGPGAITDAMARYERWLHTQVRVVEKDLQAKRQKIAEDGFAFLRGTYFRWAETIEAMCPELVTAPKVLAIGDIHLENFGVWRDEEGRLAWGVNDFDEAATMPYPFDLVRLAASAILARHGLGRARSAVCDTILAAYRKRLARPGPFILDEENTWMRMIAMADENDRRKFWNEIDRTRKNRAVPRSYRSRLTSALPPDADILWFAPRRAGVGSLGRPRHIVVANWRGGRIVREAKALVPSAWTIRQSKSVPKSNGRTLSSHRFRAPDPFFSIAHGISVRRLAPDSRKLDFKKTLPISVRLRVLEAMGGELANVHAATPGAAEAIAADLDRRAERWLQDAVKTALSMTSGDFAAWQTAQR